MKNRKLCMKFYPQYDYSIEEPQFIIAIFAYILVCTSTFCDFLRNFDYIQNNVQSSTQKGHEHKMKNGKLRKKSDTHDDNSIEEPPLITIIISYFGVYLHILFGHLSDFLRKFGYLRNNVNTENGHEGFLPLYQSYESFYRRNILRRIRVLFAIPICSVPGPEIVMMEWITKDYGWHYEVTGKKVKAINMASYNYLGFAENTGPCTSAAEEAALKYGVGVCSTRHELGNYDIHNELERLVASFIGVEDAITFGMGFATNSLNLPTLVDKDCLIVSDVLNHVSLILGSRLSGAVIRVFKHNDMQDLERVLQDAVVQGQARTHRRWKKILIIVEGIYSMEGTIVNLPEVIRLKKKYKAYLYLDEAHSIGAMGYSGRGVVDYFQCNPLDVDIHMGTFTKSFGAAGGYIAGTKKLISYLRTKSHGNCYGSSMTASVAQQILVSMRIIMGEDGTNEGQCRLKRLEHNTQYFRRRLREMGFIIYGNSHSPVVPLMAFSPAKVYLFTKTMVANGIATVAVIFPGVPLHHSRMRFCVSAAHSKEMLDKVLEVIYSVGKDILPMSSKRPPPPTKIVYEDN